MKFWFLSRRPAPHVVVLATALTIITLVISLQWLARRQHRLTAQVSIAEPVIESASVKVKDAGIVQTLPDGEVERTAVRVREVSALVLGLTLLAVSEGLQQRPINSVESLLSRFAARGLLPPGLQAHTAQGALESPLATLYVRYRPLPFGIEVVSLSNAADSGSPLLGRLITNIADEPSAALFVARSRQAALPVPFAASAEIVALNWSSEPLRERLFTPPELAQLNTWLQAKR